MPLSVCPQPIADLLRVYTEQVLAFTLTGPSLPALKGCSGQERTEFISRAIRLAENSCAEAVILIGLGSGDLAADLQIALPKTELLICEPAPQRLRDARAQGLFSDAAPLILADASVRALWFLARGAMAAKKFITCVNPELQGMEAEQAHTLQRLLRFAPAPENPPPAGEALSLYAIAHPEEPDLTAFLAHIPDWLAEVIVVWDAAAVPDKARALGAVCAVPLRHAARPLQNDFAAQRNQALSLCASAWVLTLDADERLTRDVWEHIKGEIAAPHATAYLLPRLTLYPDEQHFRMGYGLWPDPQLRLFKRDARLAYINPVHEILTGFAGCPALLPHCPITHLSYVLKNRAALTERLAVFNQAAGGEVHRLNETFPHLSLAWHKAWQNSIEELARLPLLLKI